MKVTMKIVSIALVSVLAAVLAFAQGSATGDLHLTVTDPAGKFVTNATITISDPAKGFLRSTTQNTEGEYRLLALPPGRYNVEVSAPGFSKAVFQGQIITVGQMADLPVTMQISGGETVLNVSAQSELVETSRTSSTDTIDQRRIDNLPINGRNYINFTLTDSQVVRDNAPNIGAAPTSGLNMNGQRARSNLVNVDGADAIDNSVNGVRSTVSQEAVQEFQIISNGYSAEYGRASGGVVNIITRSGSNDFHGDVYGYIRNRNFQAVNPFSNVPNPAYTRVQAGAAFGGPIKKDKTYYFFSYEVTRRHETGFSSIGSPNGNFGLVPADVSPYFGAPNGTFVIQATQDQAKFFANPGANPIALVRAYAVTVGAASGIAVNGSYPASYAILAGLGAIPTPTNGTSPLQQFFTSCNINPLNPPASNTLCNGLPANFQTLMGQVGNFPTFEGTSLYSLRLDHSFTSNNRVMLRGNASPSTVTGIEVNGQNQTFGQNAYTRTSQQTYRDAGGVFQDTWLIGTTKINEFRFQYARRGLQYFYSSAPGGSDVAVNIPGFAYFGREPYSYIDRVEQRYQFTDNFSINHGSHEMKFGADVNYIPVNATFTVNYGGVYTFGNLGADTFGFPTGTNGFPGFSPIQAYGLGIPSTLVQGAGNPRDSFKNIPLGLYWQDSWRVNHKLTFNYGVRYDVEFPPKFAAPTGLPGAAYNQLGIQKGIQTDKNNFQPRIGLAWDPFGTGKNVFRASYGMFYDHPLLGLYFLGDASDASKTVQLVFAGGSPCSTTPGNPALAMNATNTFQGILNTGACLPTVPGYLPAEQRFDAANADLFLNQTYLQPSTFFPLAFQPFGYPQSKNFVYAYSHQANLTFEHDLGHNMAMSLAYNFNGGRHINRPINANTARGDLLVANWRAAVLNGDAAPSTNPLFVNACGVGAGGPYVPAALTNFFRPSGLNPAVAIGMLNSPTPITCKNTSLSFLQLATQMMQAGGLNTNCDLTTLAGCVPFSDMDANFSNGSSVYHGLTANLRKRFGGHTAFQASYTWSHSIDDSTDLQSPLAPQDSFMPSLERSNSLFDQRHRFVFSGTYQTGKLSSDNFAAKLLSNWTFAPIIEVASGRPFNILTGNPDNLQFSPSTGRPNIVPAGTPDSPCGDTVASSYSPTGFFQEPCYVNYLFTAATPTLLGLDGNFPRNGGLKPWTVFNDLRVSRMIFFNERVNLEMSADIFNIANKFNVADVNQLFVNAGQPTSAYDPRQFQFGLKLKW